jgi:hypothetical protein
MWGKTFSVNTIPLLLLCGGKTFFANVISWSLLCGGKSSFCTRCFVFIVVWGKTGKTFCCKRYFSVVVVWGKKFSVKKISLLLLGAENHLFANVISQSFLCGGKTFSVTSTFFPKDTKTRRRGCHFLLNLFRFVSDVKKMSI